MTNKICSECGTEQDDAFNYCKNCGALLSDETDDFLSNSDEYRLPEYIENQNEKYDNSNDVKICPECGAEQEIFAKFCRNCGALFSGENKDESTMRCEHCGAELKDEAFCPDCGKATGITICPNCRQKVVNEDFCSFCGYQINREIRICANCGSKIDAMAKVCAHCGAKTIKKNPIVALGLSLIFPGLGQLYNNQTNKGIILIIGYIVSFVLCLILIGIILVILIWIYGMYDAFISAKAINKGEILEDRLF
ncbi:double zinc ribbon domain-containing protein [Methanobrevibacter sp.]|uniref:double zinc ribbon domain-containing protein n=1 Tax=Methanobrevibacter sp. TaxID=66852 RepID=UPI00386421D0